MNAGKLLDIAKSYGTPAYVFDLDAFDERAQQVKAALGERVQLCYSVKANPFLIGHLPACFSYLEVCSPGELHICRHAGVAPEKILFSGVNKTEANVREAVEYGAGLLTAESLLHVTRINDAARAQKRRVPVLLRLTAGDQFGMDPSVVRQIICQRDALENVELVGLHFFSGTQKKKAAVIEREIAYVTEFASELLRDYGYETKRLEYGPGLFAAYFSPDADQEELRLLQEVAPILRAAGERFSLCIEMGRFFASPCGDYLTSVADTKTNCGVHYAILDGGIHQMNYDGQLFSKVPPPITMLTQGEAGDRLWTLCGSLCSMGDILARKICLPQLKAGDVLAFHRAGAYSVTEGIALFLSRDLPQVLLWSERSGVIPARGRLEMAQFNTF